MSDADDFRHEGVTPAEHGAALATRDGRAQDTYDKIGVHVIVAG